MADRPEELQGDAQWRSAGDRIQTLLDATSAGGVAARERAEQLVREVVELYGAGLSRIIATVGDQADPGILDRLVADDLVASLLLVHGLHPHDVRRRVSDALDRVRPYLGSHGGDVHLLDIVGDTVQLQFAGSCKSCPSSAVTLELAVEDAIRAAAPEISSIEVVPPEAGQPRVNDGDPGRIAARSGPFEGAVQRQRLGLASGARPGRPGSRRSRRLLGRRRCGAGLPGRRPVVRLP